MWYVRDVLYAVLYVRDVLYAVLYVRDVLYAVLYVRGSCCFVVRGCGVSRRYIDVCYCDMFRVVNVYT